MKLPIPSTQYPHYDSNCVAYIEFLKNNTSIYTVCVLDYGFLMSRR